MSTTNQPEAHLQELADEHDLDVEQLRSIADASMSECWECGRDEEEIEPIYPYAVGGGERAVLCWECYADYLRDVTTLAGNQGDVWALYVAGAELKDIDGILDVSTGASHTSARRAREKADEAVEQVEKLHATIELVAENDPVNEQ